ISVVGYDDTEDSSCYIPPLTTIKQDFSPAGANQRGPLAATISVVGYDDTEDSSCYIPPLTTIKQDFSPAGAN
ncbi:hypothetical protein VS883_28605, partial [Escherichia coli]